MQGAACGWFSSWRGSFDHLGILEPASDAPENPRVREFAHEPDLSMDASLRVPVMDDLVDFRLCSITAFFFHGLISPSNI
jgi:hypothetical protein